MEDHDKTSGINFKLFTKQMTPKFKEQVYNGKVKLGDIMTLSPKGEDMLYRMVCADYINNHKEILEQDRPKTVLERFKGFCNAKHN